MYTIIRRIHLYAGVVLMSFVLMYFATGWVMIHESWFPRPRPKPTTRAAAMTISDGDLPANDPAAAAAFVQRALDLPGQRNVRQTAPAKPGAAWVFSFSHPGAIDQVTLPPPPAGAKGAAVTATIAHFDLNGAGTMNAFHRLRGFGGGWKYDVWAVFYDAAALSLILFSLSGIYLWWKLSRVKWPGLLTLGAGMALTIGTMLYLALSR